MEPSSSSSSSPVPKRLGYWLTARKYKRRSFSDIAKALQDCNVEAVKIDLTSPLAGQGEFDGFFHRLTDDIAKADLGDIEAKIILSNIEEYLENHPTAVMIDPISSIRVVMDRFKTYSSIQSCDFETKETVFVPSFILLESLQCDIPERMRLSKVDFPVVCKALIGHGHEHSHQMTLIFNMRGFSQCQFPCIIQSFVNHNAILYKLLAIGDEFYMVQRSSIRNVFPTDELDPIHFHSDDISKPNAQSELIIQDPNEMEIISKPSEYVLKNIVQTIHRELNIGLFGVDVFLENGSGRYAIIDVNIVPSYGIVPDFANLIATYIRKELDKVALSKPYHFF